MKEYYVESVWTDGNRASKETPYDDLAAAIVKQAAHDYVRVIRTLWQKNIKIVQRRNLLLEKVELEEFFYSPWYEWLTDIDAENLMDRCRVIAREKEKQAIKNRNKAKIRKMLKEQEKQQLSAQDGATDVTEVAEAAESKDDIAVDTVEGGQTK